MDTSNNWIFISFVVVIELALMGFIWVLVL